MIESVKIKMIINLRVNFFAFFNVSFTRIQHINLSSKFLSNSNIPHSRKKRRQILILVPIILLFSEIQKVMPLKDTKLIGGMSR